MVQFKKPKVNKNDIGKKCQFNFNDGGSSVIGKIVGTSNQYDTESGDIEYDVNDDKGRLLVIEDSEIKNYQVVD